MRILLPLYGLVLAVFAAGVLFVFKTGLDEYVASQGLAASELVAPDGWTARPYQTADGELITKVSFDDTNVGNTTQDILAKYEIETDGLRKASLTTFVRADELVALRISAAPHLPKRDSLASRLGRVSAEDVAENDIDRVFATLAGLPVIEQPRFSNIPGDDAPLPVNYRYFTTVIGDQTVDEVLELSILTNSSDAAVLAVLNGLDMAALHDHLPTPDPRVIASAGVLTRDALPLSDVPPPPSPAYRAKQLLDAGQVFEAPWQNALIQIRTGEIESWDDLHARYPRIDTLPFALLEVLDDGSHDNAARYFAAILSNSGRTWTGHEYHVLATVSEAGTTQADLAEYLAGQFDIAPEVLALARRLPEAPEVGETATQVVQSGFVPTIGLRTSGTCVIENGSRRCVVSNN